MSKFTNHSYRNGILQAFEELKEYALPLIEETGDPVWIGCENKTIQQMMEGERKEAGKNVIFKEHVKYKLCKEIIGEARALTKAGYGKTVFMPLEKEEAHKFKVRG